jgi:lipid A 3-O-deacylase
MKKQILLSCLSLYLAPHLLCAQESNVLGIDSVSIEAGSTFRDEDKDTNMGRLGVQWSWNEPLFKNDSIVLKGYWDATVGYWHTEDSAGTHSIGDFGITPVLRLQANGSEKFVPYVELGIGAHYLTERTISQYKQFSTNFQFGDHIAAGIKFGEHDAFAIAYRLQHLSNAGIDHPNPGINFHQIRLEYNF